MLVCRLSHALSFRFVSTTVATSAYVELGSSVGIVSAEGPGCSFDCVPSDKKVLYFQSDADDDVLVRSFCLLSLLAVAHPVQALK